jgi:phosphatidylglycerophosphatase C
MKPGTSTLAFFDFDKTIVSLDTGYEFIKHRLQSNILRRFIALLFSPVVILFYANLRLRVVCHSMILWISTVGLCEDDLAAAKRQFLDDYCSNKNAYAFPDAIKRMDYHLKKGHAVYIVSGAPVWIIESLAKKLGLENCTIIGSTEKPVMGGLMYEKHCYGQGKVNLLNDVIMNLPEKIYGYSDSAADIPLLSICTHKHVINPTKLHLKKFKRAFGHHIRVLNWA